MNITVKQFLEGFERSSKQINYILRDISVTSEYLLENYREDIIWSLNAREKVIDRAYSEGCGNQAYESIINSSQEFLKYKAELIQFGIDEELLTQSFKPRTLKLWIDDDAKTPGMDLFRYPPDESWNIAITVDEAKKFVETYGYPQALGLDHDIGDEKVMVFLSWLEENNQDKLPPIYTIHSKNPVGEANIIAFMESWRKSRSLS